MPVYGQRPGSAELFPKHTERNIFGTYSAERNMDYCLKEEYLLRGWDKLPTGIVKRLSGQVFFLQPGFYKKSKI